MIGITMNNPGVGREETAAVRMGVGQVRPWTAETPELYHLYFTLLDESADTLEVIKQRIGFRTVEVKDGLLQVNGVPITVKGVNRHEHDPFTGHVVSEERMVEDLRLIKAANMNAFIERWIQSVKHECLDHFLVFGEDHFNYLISEYVAYYHTERPHQSLGNEPIASELQVANRGGDDDEPIACRERLGGLLKHYYRKAA